VGGGAAPLGGHEWIRSAGVAVGGGRWGCGWFLIWSRFGGLLEGEGAWEIAQGGSGRCPRAGGGVCRARSVVGAEVGRSDEEWSV